jgi:hypothetical protein
MHARVETAMSAAECLCSKLQHNLAATHITSEPLSAQSPTVLASSALEAAPNVNGLAQQIAAPSRASSRFSPGGSSPDTGKRSTEVLRAAISKFEMQAFSPVLDAAPVAWERSSTRLSLGGVVSNAKRTTVGLLLQDCVVVSCISKTIGAPAEEWGTVQKGDVISSVDGKAVSSETVAAALTGSDVPGSRLELEIFRQGKGAKKPAQELHVWLTRMPACGRVTQNRIKLHDMLVAAKQVKHVLASLAAFALLCILELVTVLYDSIDDLHQLKQHAIVEFYDATMAEEGSHLLHLANSNAILLMLGSEAAQCQVDLLEIIQVLCGELRSCSTSSEGFGWSQQMINGAKQRRIHDLVLEMSTEMHSLLREHEEIVSHAVHERKVIEKGFQKEVSRLYTNMNAAKSALLECETFHDRFLVECEGFTERQTQVLQQIGEQYRESEEQSERNYQLLLQEGEADLQCVRSYVGCLKDALEQKEEENEAQNKSVQEIRADLKKAHVDLQEMQDAYKHYIEVAMTFSVESLETSLRSVVGGVEQQWKAINERICVLVEMR